MLNLLDVADILTWERSTGTPSSWRARYERLLESRMASLCHGAEGDRCILESLQLLPAARRSRFLCAPEVAGQILGSRRRASFDSGFIAVALLGELATAGVITRLPSAVWTALGDRCLDPEAPETWRDDGAGLLGTPIVVDDRGPIDFSCEANDELIPLSDAERLLVRDKLVQAAGAVAATSDVVFRFWTDCVTVIAVRKTARPSPRFLSNSAARQAGLTLLINGHLGHVGSPLLADALVHESIHSLLFTYEEIETPFVSQPPEVEQIKLRSPWSGAELRLISYVHACVVWYGMYWFWNAASRTRSFSAAVTEKEMALARAGFRRHPFSKGLGPSVHFLSAEVAELLRELEGRMLSV